MVMGDTMTLLNEKINKKLQKQYHSQASCKLNPRKMFLKNMIMLCLCLAAMFTAVLRC